MLLFCQFIFVFFSNNNIQIKKFKVKTSKSLQNGLVFQYISAAFDQIVTSLENIRLNIAQYQHGIVKLSNYELLVLGGLDTDNNYLNNIEQVHLPLHPTAAPTESPSYSPTASPTLIPSIAPSISPTKSPTQSPLSTPSTDRDQ